jgi:hypothetical protein
MRNIDNKVKDIIVQSVLKQEGKNTYNAYIHKKVLTDAADIAHLQNNMPLKHSITDVYQTCVFIGKEPHLN